MSELALHVEALPGATILQVAEQMITLAHRLDVLVETEFNDVPIMSNGHESVDEIVQSYRRRRAIQVPGKKREGEKPR